MIIIISAAAVDDASDDTLSVTFTVASNKGILIRV